MVSLCPLRPLLRNLPWRPSMASSKSIGEAKLGRSLMLMMLMMLAMISHLMVGMVVILQMMVWVVLLLPPLTRFWNHRQPSPVLMMMKIMGRVLLLGWLKVLRCHHHQSHPKKASRCLAQALTLVLGVFWTRSFEKQHCKGLQHWRHSEKLHLVKCMFFHLSFSPWTVFQLQSQVPTITQDNGDSGVSIRCHFQKKTCIHEVLLCHKLSRILPSQKCFPSSGFASTKRRQLLPQRMPRLLNRNLGIRHSWLKRWHLRAQRSL